MLSKIDGLRLEYTLQRYFRKKPTVAVWEKLNKAVNADLRYAATRRKALSKPSTQQGELGL